MCEVENNIKISWQFVSQFVSWDFCRYMCEQRDSQTSYEPDVLTFLRNMIVERTEKAASDITKHEIVAKFVMEARTIRAVSRMSCIYSLSETVKRICPELKSAVDELLPQLESFLNVLDWNEDSQKDEIVLKRIEDAVNSFSIEACKILPLPDLLQVIQTCLTPEFQNLLQKTKSKSIKNIELYQRVVKCLQEEIITPTETRIIALALYEDKALEKIILNSETETEDGSQQQSQAIQSSQAFQEHLHSDPSIQLSSLYKLPIPVQEVQPANITQPFTFEPNLVTLPDHQTQTVLSPNESFDPSSPEHFSESVEAYKAADGIQELDSLNPAKSYLFKPSHTEPHINLQPPQVQDHHVIPVCSSDSDSSDFAPSAIITSRKRDRLKRFLKECQCEDISDESEKVIPSSKLKKPVAHLEEIENVSVLNIFTNHTNDSDTSDCDKDPELRFLTPTMFKKDYVAPSKPLEVLLSDTESLNSSVTTNPTNSQQYDPTFKTRCNIEPARNSPILPPKKRLKTMLRNTEHPKLSIKVLRKNSKDLEIPKQMTLRRYGFASNKTNDQDVERNAEKSVRSSTRKVAKKKFKLFDNDIAGTTSLDESSLFHISTRSKKQSPKQKYAVSSTKRRCDECKITFRNPIELRKHVFIQHTVEDLSDD